MRYLFKVTILLFTFVLIFSNLAAEEKTKTYPASDVLEALQQHGLDAQIIRKADFHVGAPPENFLERTGATYKPSYNQDPSIPAQCWIETGYGTQNACLYCHTDYLSKIEHGNAFPLGEDQILYSFPTPDLNKVLWRNTIFPQEISDRLEKEGISLPDWQDVAYVRRDNWQPAFAKARPAAGTGWFNKESYDFVLFPALDPSNLFPYREKNPTRDGTHGYVDTEGFVRDKNAAYTGWRAINFFSLRHFQPAFRKREWKLYSASEIFHVRKQQV